MQEWMHVPRRLRESSAPTAKELHDDFSNAQADDRTDAQAIGISHTNALATANSKSNTSS
jgi:hypothetical protein